jgi:hypothetical protein
MVIGNEAGEGGYQAAAAACNYPFSIGPAVKLGGSPIGDDYQWLSVPVHSLSVISA